MTLTLKNCIHLQRSGTSVTLIECELARRPRILLKNRQHQLTDAIQRRELHHHFRKKKTAVVNLSVNNSVVQNISLKPTDTQSRNSRHFMKPQGWLLCSQQTATHP
jgi:hypothetical protein